VHEATTLADAITAARACPGVLVLDVCLLDGASESDFLEIRQLQDSVPILFVGLAQDSSHPDSVKKAGGHTYVCKTRTPSELLAAIRRVAWTHENGGTQTTEDLRTLAVSSGRFSSATSLTAREQEILKILAEGRTVRQTAGELALSVKTVEAHKLNLMRKLNIHKRSTLIDYAVENGLVDPIAAK
jgi:two-component system response regulator NreC